MTASSYSDKACWGCGRIFQTVEGPNKGRPLKDMFPVPVNERGHIFCIECQDQAWDTTSNVRE